LSAGPKKTMVNWRPMKNQWWLGGMACHEWFDKLTMTGHPELVACTENRM